MQIWMAFYFSDKFGSSLRQGGSESVNITCLTPGVHQLCTLLMGLGHMFHNSMFPHVDLGCLVV